MANNPPLYNAVIAGITGGSQQRWITDTDSASYNDFQTMVNAVASAVDDAIPVQPGGVTVAEAALMQSITGGVFADRYPISDDPSNYDSIASAIVALYQEMAGSLDPSPSFSVYTTNAAPGPEGDEGEMGYPGPQGIAGPAGAMGPWGMEGDEGEQGMPGPPGPTGADGTIPDPFPQKTYFANPQDEEAPPDTYPLAGLAGIGLRLVQGMLNGRAPYFATLEAGINKQTAPDGTSHPFILSRERKRHDRSILWVFCSSLATLITPAGYALITGLLDNGPTGVDSGSVAFERILDGSESSLVDIQTTNSQTVYLYQWLIRASNPLLPAKWTSGASKFNALSTPNQSLDTDWLGAQALLFAFSHPQQVNRMNTSYPGELTNIDEVEIDPNLGMLGFGWAVTTQTPFNLGSFGFNANARPAYALIGFPPLSVAQFQIDPSILPPPGDSDNGNTETIILQPLLANSGISPSAVQPGPPGDEGVEGEMGFPGPAGPIGPTGPMGIGAPGDAGEDGESIIILQPLLAPQVIYQPGYPGDPGDEGEQGIPGAVGPQGPIGPMGIGVPGDPGEDGEMIILQPLMPAPILYMPSGPPGEPGDEGEQVIILQPLMPAPIVFMPPGPPGEPGDEGEQVIILQPVVANSGISPLLMHPGDDGNDGDPGPPGLQGDTGASNGVPAAFDAATYFGNPLNAAWPGIQQTIASLAGIGLRSEIGVLNGDAPRSITVEAGINPQASVGNTIHTFALTRNRKVGDRIAIFIVGTFASIGLITAGPVGWNATASVGISQVGIIGYEKPIDGTESSLIQLTTSGAADLTCIQYLIRDSDTSRSFSSQGGQAAGTLSSISATNTPSAGLANNLFIGIAANANTLANPTLFSPFGIIESFTIGTGLVKYPVSIGKSKVSSQTMQAAWSAAVAPGRCIMTMSFPPLSVVRLIADPSFSPAPSTDPDDPQLPPSPQTVPILPSDLGPEQLNRAPLFDFRFTIATSGSMAADDVTLFNGNAPFAFRITDVTAFISTAQGLSMIQLRDTAGGGGNALSSLLSSSATGTQRNNDTQTRTVAANGSLFLRRTNGSVVGEIVITAIRV